MRVVLWWWPLHRSVSYACLDKEWNVNIQKVKSLYFITEIKVPFNSCGRSVLVSVGIERSASTLDANQSYIAPPCYNISSTLAWSMLSSTTGPISYSFPSFSLMQFSRKLWTLSRRFKWQLWLCKLQQELAGCPSPLCLAPSPVPPLTLTLH